MNRFKHITVLAVGMALALPISNAHADGITDYVHLEFGTGWQISKDMGDGTWFQQGGPYTRRMNSPTFLAGLTGDLWQRGNFSARYHADYVYFGGLEAGCQCVPDNQYNPQAHVRVIASGQNPSLYNFTGGGHVQGIPVTLDIGYSWSGWRFAAEAGAWAYWQAWHVTAAPVGGESYNLSHRTSLQFGYVAGARIERGPFSLSYRYYSVRANWNPNPGIVTGTQMLMVVYRF